MIDRYALTLARNSVKKARELPKGPERDYYINKAMILTKKIMYEPCIMVVNGNKITTEVNVLTGEFGT